MNKVILMGRLVKDVEIRYAGGEEQSAVGTYTLAVNRKYKKNGEQEVDFINCVTFGKSATFAEKYFAKGQLVSVVGRLQVRSYEDKNGQKKWATNVIVDEQFFAESKKNGEKAEKKNESNDGFYPIDESLEDDDLPF